MREQQSPGYPGVLRSSFPKPPECIMVQNKLSHGFAACLLVFLCWVAPALSAAPADLIVTGAKIYTADSGKTIAESMAIKNGHILYVGPESGLKPFVGPLTRIESAAGRLILPGLIDSHLHPPGIVDLDICTLSSQAKSLRAIAELVRGCIDRYHIAPGEWVSVRQWNFSNGNEPDAEFPTLQAALDRASLLHPVQLLGNDGHHGAFNSTALARARNADGKVVGFSGATLASDFSKYRHLVGVDVRGEPNGTVNEDARRRMDTPSLRSEDIKQLMADPGRLTRRLNGAGITGILDASTSPEALLLYDELEKLGLLTARTSLALYYDPDAILDTKGSPDWALMVARAKATRERYANDPLIRADFVKLFADGVLEGNPYAMPPTLPEVAGVKPYLQPIYARDAAGRLSVTGYVDPDSEVCTRVRKEAQAFDLAATESFMHAHGFHPRQCEIGQGALQHSREVILEFVRQFHLAGFSVHIHAIGDMPVRTAVEAITAARDVDRNRDTHDGLAHIQLVNPEDKAAIGREHLYLAFTYAWAYTDPEYDLSVVPFFDKVKGAEYGDLHPKDGYYERNAYPVRELRDLGANLVAGSDAPVDTSDPRPFVNMAMAVSRRVAGRPALNPTESISIRDVIDAYTINGAKFLFRGDEAGSLEVGKFADFIIVDRDIIAMADHGVVDDIAKTQVLKTFFAGREVYSASPPR